MEQKYSNLTGTPSRQFSNFRLMSEVTYTTNVIESLNATYRKLNSQQSVFPSDTTLLKALYLATFEATKSG
jgi:transposase-like protein